MRVTFCSEKVSAELTMRVNSCTFSFLTFCILILVIPLAQCDNNAVLSRVCYVDSEILELVYPFEKKIYFLLCFLLWICEVWFSIYYNNLIIEKNNNTLPIGDVKLNVRYFEVK